MTTMTSMPSLTQNPYHNANYENKYFNKTNIYIYQCWNEYSNDSNIRIKVSESLDSDSDLVQLQMSNKIRIRKKIFYEYYSDSDSLEKKDSFQHCYITPLT